MTLAMVTIQEFDAAAGASIARLNAAAIISALTRVFDALAKEAREGEDFADRWMGQGEPPAGPEGASDPPKGDPPPDEPED